MMASIIHGRSTRITERIFLFITIIILEGISPIMCLENTVIFLGDTGMTKILEWRDTAIMMINPERKYGFGVCHSKE
ncbi:hypothetical protein D3C72_496620 [compost metagenome]